MIFTKAKQLRKIVVFGFRKRLFTTKQKQDEKKVNIMY